MIKCYYLHFQVFNILRKVPVFKKTVLIRVLAVGIALCIPFVLYGESENDILVSARTLPSAQAQQLLEKKLPVSGNLRSFFLLELARLSGEGGNWQKSLFWSQKQDLSSLSKEIGDDIIRWYGEALEKTDQTDAARDLYRKHLKNFSVQDPLVYLSYFRLGNKDTELLLSQFDTAFPLLKHTAPDTFALSRYLSGICAVREGAWNVAASSFSRFSPDREANFPDLAPWSRYYLAYSLYRLGRWDESVAAFTRYLDGWSTHSFAWQAASTAALAAIQGTIDPLPLAERAVHLAPSGPEKADSVLLQASLLIDRKKYALAETLLTEIADGTATKGQTAQSPRAQFMLAEISVRQKNNKLAEQRWLKLISDFPRSSLAEESLYRVGENWYISSEYERSVSFFTQYRQKWPAGVFLNSVLRTGGDALLQSGSTDLAILWWEDFLKKFPQDASGPRVYLDLISVTRKKGEFSASLRYARAYLARFPQDAKLDGIQLEIEELVKLEKGESAGNAELSTKYIRVGRSSSSEGRATGILLARSYAQDYNRRSEALDILREITVRMPAKTDNLPESEKRVFASSWNLLGNMQRENGMYKEASLALLSAGTLYAEIDGERSAEALYGALDCFIQAGMTADAQKTAETLKKKWPQSLWTRRASLLME